MNIRKFHAPLEKMLATPLPPPPPPPLPPGRPCIDIGEHGDLVSFFVAQRSRAVS